MIDKCEINFVIAIAPEQQRTKATSFQQIKHPTAAITSDLNILESRRP